MSKPSALAPEFLYRPCDPASFAFSTTAELTASGQITGQDRAIEAVRFGIGIRHEGYNLYVMGPPGSGKQTLLRQLLRDKASTRPTPDDWCYVNNFTHSHRPQAIGLPAGMGSRFSQAVEKLVDELVILLPAIFSGEDYQNRVQALQEELNKRQESSVRQLIDEAAAQQVELLRTSSGFTFAPMQEDKVLEVEAFAQLENSAQQHINEKIHRLQERLRSRLEMFPAWNREMREKLRELNCTTARTAVHQLVEQAESGFPDQPAIREYLHAIEQDIIDHIDELLPGDEEDEFPRKDAILARYQVTVLVDNKALQGAPIVYLDNPGYMNLVGRAEHIAQFGTVLKAGALHQANGGYLLIDASKLLSHPFAWEGLKRVLRAGEIRIETLERMLSLASAISLEPGAIPLDVKVILLGDRMTYYLLHDHDADFSELFKVAADLDERIPRDSSSINAYAQLIASLAHKETLRPFDRHAVARTIEHCSRLADDQNQLTTHMRSLADILREADYWAGEIGRNVISAAEIERAIGQQIQRSSRVRERLLEEVRDGSILIETDGRRIGQVNGLSVLTTGDFSFGQVSRITATAHIGEGNVIDIEREVELGGSIHSKGVLILSSFIAQRYAVQYPLALSASLVFEQSYGMVDGDSASLAELCALLSVLAGLPVLQSLAVTGSISQHGEVQAISGVNEKIEGFFDTCLLQGLTGRQGVLIPASNTRHLMLRRDVREAAAAGRFHVYPVDAIDEALSLLLDGVAGVRDSAGNWPEESINGRIQGRLIEMALIRVGFGELAKEKTVDVAGLEKEQDASLGGLIE